MVGKVVTEELHLLLVGSRKMLVYAFMKTDEVHAAVKAFEKAE